MKTIVDSENLRQNILREKHEVKFVWGYTGGRLRWELLNSSHREM